MTFRETQQVLKHGKEFVGMLQAVVADHPELMEEMEAFADKVITMYFHGANNAEENRCKTRMAEMETILVRNI